MMDVNCPRCGARYCGSDWLECRARLGSVYVAGEGYVPELVAAQLAAEGRDVRWSDKGWED